MLIKEKEKYIEEIDNLIKELNYYTYLYDLGTPAISDQEWDKKYFELVNLENKIRYFNPNSPTQNINYQVVNSLEKVKHNHPMLSLDKTKDWLEFIRYFNRHSVIGMCKLDGLTCSLRYADGKLVSAETRGNGIEGENILHNALVLPSIPCRIDHQGELVLDGEVICTYENFKKFSDKYSNPRNFAAGSIRLLDSYECSQRNLEFLVWNVVSGIDSNNFLERLNKVEKLGFQIVPWTSSFDWDAKDFLIEQAEKLGYPIDGLVGRFDDIHYGESLGTTGHHSKAAYAFKFYDEIYETTLLDIEWSMGRTGILTPIAIFEPIEIDGAIIERASLHNLSIMNELSRGFERIGDKLFIYKANQIIPQVESWRHQGNYSKEDHLLIPNNCPYCGEPTIIKSDNNSKFLYCSNPQCEGRLINKLDHFCSRTKGLDIRGLSKATLEKLIEWNWVLNLEDIYNLYKYEEEWQKKPGFGVRSVKNILNAIEDSKKCKLENFISAIGIPLIGTNNAKEICKHINTYQEFKELINNKFSFSEWDTFGIEKEKSILKFDYSIADKLIDEYLIIEKIQPKENNSNNLVGVKVCITGTLKNYKNRAAMQKDIENAGGKVVSSMNKSVNYLINNNAESSSAKNRSAKQFNIPIISEEEFIKKFLQA